MIKNKLKQIFIVLTVILLLSISISSVNAIDNNTIIKNADSNTNSVSNLAVTNQSNIQTNLTSTEIQASNTNQTYNQKQSLKINLSSNNTGLNDKNITVTLSNNIGSKSYYIQTDSNGTGELPITLYPGNYYVNYTFNGDESYLPCSGFTILTVNKINTNLALNNQPNIGKGDYLNLSLQDINGNPIISQYVTLTLSNSKNQSKTYNIQTDSNGIAKLQINLNYANYSVYYIFPGTRTYNPSNNGTFNFIINGTLIKADDLILTYPGNKYFNISLTDRFNNPLINKTVNLQLNGNTYNLTTNENGIAQLNIIANSGTYPVTFTYTDENPYFSSNGTSTITINKLNTYLTGEDINTNSDSGTVYNITLYDQNNNPLSNKQVTITLYRSDYDITGRADQTFTYTLTTNEDGVASLQLNQGAGYYSIESIFNEEENYYYSTTNNDLFINGTVLVALDRAMAAYANDEFTIKLKDMEGNLIANQTITLTINSDTYTLTTNNTGVASVNLSYAVGNYTMNYNYQGSSEYLPSNDSSKLLISILDIKHGSLDVSPYLVATTNCQVNNALIKSTAKSLTANCTTDYEKAVAIFNFVRDTLEYSGYSNTRYGAYKTLLYKVGNCCDHAHLICALCRAAGLPSRYYHGTCYFTRTGNWIGHVWASVLVGNSWLVMDPTSSKNLAGYVNSWKNSNYIKKGVYATLPI